MRVKNEWMLTQFLFRCFFLFVFMAYKEREGLKVGGEGDDRGWDDWMASRTRWTWAWVNSRSWWWTGRPGVLQSMGSLRVGHNWATSFSLACSGEGNGNPLQYSCLEDPRDGGAWWATVSEVAQSRTWLKQLSSSSSSMFGGSFLNMSFLDNFFFFILE